jgi:hypothetical protein
MGLIERNQKFEGEIIDEIKNIQDQGPYRKKHQKLRVKIDVIKELIERNHAEFNKIKRLGITLKTKKRMN